MIKGDSEGGYGIEMEEESTSGSLLHAREVEVAGMAKAVSKCKKDPPPARFCMRGRWRRREQQEQCRNTRGVHLRLTVACEGGGGGANGIKTP